MVLRALVSALGDTSFGATTPQDDSVNIGHDEVHMVVEALVDILGNHKLDFTVGVTDATSREHTGRYLMR